MTESKAISDESYQAFAYSRILSIIVALFLWWPFPGHAQVITGASASVSASASGLVRWDSGTTYATNDVVLDRGCFWKATGASTNSEPVSGNTDWTYLSGVCSVTINTLASALAASNSVPIVFVPSPGAGHALHVWSWSGTRPSRPSLMRRPMAGSCSREREGAHSAKGAGKRDATLAGESYD
jgi:hypothetical protein